MLINVKVNTNSSKREVIKINESSYIIKFKTAREKGKANEKLIEILSEYFRIPKSRIQIIKGLTSSRKVIELAQ